MKRPIPLILAAATFALGCSAGAGTSENNGSGVSYPEAYIRGDRNAAESSILLAPSTSSQHG